MKRYISSYLCFTQVRLGKRNQTDIYYYAGVLISPSGKNKSFDELPEDIQHEVLNLIMSLQAANFKEWKTGLVNEGRHYVIATRKKVEVFKVEFYELGIRFKEFLMTLEEEQFEKEVEELRNTAICVFQDQYFTDAKYKKKKIYPIPNIL